MADRGRNCSQRYHVAFARDVLRPLDAILSQAIQKRGLARALITDNGAAMVAGEFREGLLQLGVVHETTLPYSVSEREARIFLGHVGRTPHGGAGASFETDLARA